jgi:glycerophosphoryl diester phosphodiesterase
MDKYQSKLLSHRFRGLADIEYSRHCFTDIGLLAIKYFELDTRISKDGVIFVYHDSKLRMRGAFLKIAKTSAKEISSFKYTNGEGLLMLADALQLFAQHANQNQFLCIDIKDYGFEKEHLNLVRKYHLEDRVFFISWIPQVILKLKAAGTHSPLIFACWKIRKMHTLGDFIAHLVRNRIWPFKHYIMMGGNRITDDLLGFSTGYQHALVCTDLPRLLLQAIQESGGGICIHKAMYCEKVAEFCQRNHTQLWLYNENKPEKFKRLADDNRVHVIFSDNALKISQ